MSRCSTSHVVHGDMNHPARINGRSRDSLRHTGPECPVPHRSVPTAITVTRGPIVVLDAIDLTVAEGDTIGLIGPNGVGKTTLLRALAGQIAPDRGAVELTPPTATVGYLPQEAVARGGELVTDYLHRRTGATDASAELDAATAALAAGEDGADTRYDAALTRWLSLGVADLPGDSARCGRS